MPLWRIYHPNTTFTKAEEKAALSQDVTSIYTAVGLPAFYVNVLFIPLSTSDIYIGGRTTSDHPLPGSTSTNPFIRIFISNIARKLPTSEWKRLFLNKIDATLRPHIQDKGYDWEYHVDETERELWKINGIYPPETKSAGEAVWARKGKVVTFGKL